MSCYRIAYVARHNQALSNDDEGAITHALRQLGHTVVEIQEGQYDNASACKGSDLILFHKSTDEWMFRLLDIPKVCYYFDAVNCSEYLMEKRSVYRVAWMNAVLPRIQHLFCTDGDWANAVGAKATWLCQGADERMIGRGVAAPVRIPILMTATVKVGLRRMTFIEQLSSRYGTRLYHVQRGVHGNELANLIASSSVVVSPISPVTDRYWSNRVYLTLGFGGLLLHPYCTGLAEQYQDGEHLLFYNDERHFHQVVADIFLSEKRLADMRERITTNALLHTRQNHTYRHRVESMMKSLESKGIL